MSGVWSNVFRINFFFSSGKNQAARDIAGRHAINHVWAQSEPKLLVCEARELATDEKSKKQKDAYNEQVQLTKATMKDTVRIPENKNRERQRIVLVYEPKGSEKRQYLFGIMYVRVEYHIHISPESAPIQV